jgi:uroporphyrinogen decarboxylase
MQELTHRERVQLAFDHQEPDRIPIDFLGNASLILDEAYHRLLKHLKLEGDFERYRFREGTTANYYDTRLLELFDIDFHRIFLPKTPKAKISFKDSNTVRGPWGVEWNKAGIYVNAISAPLRDLDIDGIMAFEWPKAQEMYHTEGLAERARQLYEETDYALVARNPLTWGFLDRGCNLRGMDQFMMDMVLNPEMAQIVIDHILEIHLEVYDLFLQAVGPYVLMVETGDDLGAQNNLLISPDLYRQFIKPAQTKMNALIKDRAPQARIFMHNDGALYDIIPDLIESGVEVLNPVQPSAKGMESEGLKQAFGDQVVFHGAIDQPAQEGSEEDIRAEVRKRIDALAPGGGYVLSTCNHILGAPPENVVAMFEEARTYGRYPIGG